MESRMFQTLWYTLGTVNLKSFIGNVFASNYMEIWITIWNYCYILWCLRKPLEDLSKNRFKCKLRINRVRIDHVRPVVVLFRDLHTDIHIHRHCINDKRTGYLLWVRLTCIRENHIGKKPFCLWTAFSCGPIWVQRSTIYLISPHVTEANKPNWLFFIRK